MGLWEMVKVTRALGIESMSYCASGFVAARRPGLHQCSDLIQPILHQSDLISVSVGGSQCHVAVLVRNGKDVTKAFNLMKVPFGNAGHQVCVLQL
ncbi:hypothetical protein D3C77_714850 [compost metagenome]